MLNIFPFRGAPYNDLFKYIRKMREMDKKHINFLSQNTYE